MVERGNVRGRAEAGTQAWRPWSAPWSGAGRPPASWPDWAWPDGLADGVRRFAGRIREWVAVEVGPGRLVPWLAIAFGCGIVIYFSADQEPVPWAAAAVLGVA